MAHYVCACIAAAFFPHPAARRRPRLLTLLPYIAAAPMRSAAASCLEVSDMQPLTFIEVIVPGVVGPHRRIGPEIVPCCVSRVVHISMSR